MHVTKQKTKKNKENERIGYISNEKERGKNFSTFKPICMKWNHEFKQETFSGLGHGHKKVSYVMRDMRVESWLAADRSLSSASVGKDILGH